MQQPVHKGSKIPPSTLWIGAVVVVLAAVVGLGAVYVMRSPNASMDVAASAVETGRSASPLVNPGPSIAPDVPLGQSPSAATTPKPTATPTPIPIATPTPTPTSSAQLARDFVADFRTVVAQSDTNAFDGMSNKTLIGLGGAACKILGAGDWVGSFAQYWQTHSMKASDLGIVALVAGGTLCPEHESTSVSLTNELVEGTYLDSLAEVPSFARFLGGIRDKDPALLDLPNDESLVYAVRLCQILHSQDPQKHLTALLDTLPDNTDQVITMMQTAMQTSCRDAPTRSRTQVALLVQRASYPASERRWVVSICKRIKEDVAEADIRAQDGILFGNTLRFLAWDFNDLQDAPPPPGSKATKYLARLAALAGTAELAGAEADAGDAMSVARYQVIRREIPKVFSALNKGLGTNCRMP